MKPRRLNKLNLDQGYLSEDEVNHLIYLHTHRDNMNRTQAMKRIIQDINQCKKVVKKNGKSTK